MSGMMRVSERKNRGIENIFRERGEKAFGISQLLFR